jgi:hypothetical protein
MARGERLRVPPGISRLPFNRGLEAIGVVPPGTPLAGTLVAISERSRENADGADGFLIGGPAPGGFRVRRTDDYDITDLAFLPEGDMLILERRYSLLRGIAMRIRRIAAGTLTPGAVVDGPVLIEAGPEAQIDNMEALAVSRSPAGETIITLMSDDNFSFFQRNLVLRFALRDE